MWYDCLISSLDLLRCYGVHPNLLGNPHIWLGMDAIWDKLLPGCLPVKLVCIAVGADFRVKDIYDRLMLENHEHIVTAKCCMYTVSPLTLFDWNTEYADNVDTCSIIKNLLTHNCTDLPSSLISGVHKGYKYHFTKSRLIITGDKIFMSTAPDGHTIYRVDYRSIFYLLTALWSLPLGS